MIQNAFSFHSISQTPLVSHNFIRLPLVFSERIKGLLCNPIGRIGPAMTHEIADHFHLAITAMAAIRRLHVLAIPTQKSISEFANSTPNEIRFRCQKKSSAKRTEPVSVSAFRILAMMGQR